MRARCALWVTPTVCACADVPPFFFLVCWRCCRWNYWDDGPLPPSHPLHPLRRPASAAPSTAPTAAAPTGKTQVAAAPPAAPAVADVEDLFRGAPAATPSSSPFTDAPAVVDIDVGATRGDGFAPDARIRRQVRRLRKVVSSKSAFVCRVKGGLSHDAAALNAKIRTTVRIIHEELGTPAEPSAVTTVTTEPPPASASTSSAAASAFQGASAGAGTDLASPTMWMWVEVPCSRLVALSQLSDSVLLLPFVFPALQVFVEAGNETETLTELYAVADAVKWIKDLHVIVVLVLDRPFPYLGTIASWLRARPTIVRLVVLRLERSMKHLHQKVTPRAAGSSVANPGTEGGFGGTVDPVELLQALAVATSGEITADDFLPMSVGRVLRPVLEVCRCVFLRSYVGAAHTHVSLRHADVRVWAC